jgi:hypothetical protein
MIKATYISVWDGGTEIVTTCDYDPQTNVISNVEVANVDGLNLDVLDKEYLELQDGTTVTKFYNLDDDYMVGDE